MSDLDSSCFPSNEFALVRGITVSLGILFSVVWHAVLWPRSAQNSARRRLATTLNNAAQIFAAIHRQYRDVPKLAEGGHSVVDVPKLPEDGHSVHEPAVSESDGGDSPSTDSVDPPTFSAVHMTRNAFEERILIETLISDDGFGEVTELSLLNKRHVWKPLSSALLLLSSDAALWSKTKLALPAVLKELPEHFVSLAVSLSELGSVLGRKPVLSGQYNQTALRIFVWPLFYEHETLVVSLFHVSYVVQKLLVAENDPRSLASLQCAIRHLKMSLRVLHGRIGEVRRTIHSSMEGSNASKRSESKSGMRRVLSTGMLADSAAVLEIPDLSPGRDLRDFLQGVDDMVLYNAFSFASNGCMAAFLSIANCCEQHVACLLGKHESKKDD